MSKRLQVLLDEDEFEDLRRAASRQGVPVSEWVRRALREARGQEPSGDVLLRYASLSARDAVHVRPGRGGPVHTAASDYSRVATQAHHISGS